MKKHIAASLLGIWGLLCFAGEHHGQPNDPAFAQEEALQQGVEVLTKGPVHEAFAEPLDVNPRPNPIIGQKPPAPIEEIPPDQKPEGSNIQWIPGYFAWDETSNEFVWISGFWRAVPPGQQWIPGHWIAVDDGWQWVSGYWAAESQTEIEYLPPPPASIDTGPSVAAPDADSLYAPGIWVYQSRRYLWRPGFWYRGHPQWVYHPARYVWTPAGCIFLEAYWDYPLDRRGLLFAPVHFAHGVWNAPGWYYQPRYAIAVQALVNSLFARRDFGRYYFGDYYAPEHHRLGFVPWFDYRPARNIPDPLFHYTRWHARTDPQWEPAVRRLHQDRLAGLAPRPPATLVQQKQLIQNITVNNKIQINNKTVTINNPQKVVQNVTTIAPITKIDQRQYKLQRVTKDQQVEYRKIAQQVQTTALERQQRETKIVSQGSPPTKPTDPPARVKLSPTKISAPAKEVRVQTPPPPVIPKQVERPLPKQEPTKPIYVKPPAPKGKENTPAPKEKVTPPAPKEKIIPFPPKDKEKPLPPKVIPPAPKGKEKEKPPAPKVIPPAPKDKEKPPAPKVIPPAPKVTPPAPKEKEKPPAPKVIPPAPKEKEKPPAPKVTPPAPKEKDKPPAPKVTLPAPKVIPPAPKATPPAPKVIPPAPKAKEKPPAPKAKEKEKPPAPKDKGKDSAQLLVEDLPLLAMTLDRPLNRKREAAILRFSDGVEDK